MLDISQLSAHCYMNKSFLLYHMYSTQALVFQPNSTVLALSYEWIGEKLYFIDLDPSSRRQMRIWRVPIIFTEAIEQVYPPSGDLEGIVVPEGSGVEFVIDPFRGYVGVNCN